MMINRRLIDAVGESRKYIAGNVVAQWFSLVANIIMMGTMAHFLQCLYENTLRKQDVLFHIFLIILSLAVRFVCTLFFQQDGIPKC